MAARDWLSARRLLSENLRACPLRRHQSIGLNAKTQRREGTQRRMPLCAFASKLLLLVAGFDGEADAAAHVERARDGHFQRFERCHQIVKNLVGDMLVE